MTTIRTKKYALGGAFVLGGLVVAGAVGWLIVWAASVSDTFGDETKIGKGTDKAEVAGGQVKLAACYTASPSWTKTADTIVRDISVLNSGNATTTKDIYCDDNNCILVTDEVVPGSTVCVATNSDVYASVLWAKADTTTSPRTWGNSSVSPNTNSTAISGNDIGGTHASDFRAGDDNELIGAKNFLEHYYDSPTGHFPAMDRCKEKGSGWRLPTLLELDSIRDQAIGSAPFSRLSGIASAIYWSSSESSATVAYRLVFVSGTVDSTSKTSTNNVRCVRGQ